MRTLGTFAEVAEAERKFATEMLWKTMTQGYPQSLRLAAEDALGRIDRARAAAVSRC